MSKHRIKEIRENTTDENGKKLSGTKVAKLLGITPQYYYEIERGEKNLSAEIAGKLAGIFGVTTDYLIGRSDSSDETLHTLQQRVKKQRDLLGLSIEQLAIKIGWKPETLRTLEENPNKLPGQKTLDKLSHNLGVTRDYLLGYTNDPKGVGSGVYQTDPDDLKRFIAESRTLNYGGDIVEMDDEMKEFFDQQLRIAFTFAKEKNREKFGNSSKKGGK